MRKLFFLLFLATTALHAQDGLGKWFSYLGANGFGKNWTFHNEVQYRAYEDIGDLHQFMLRTGVGYNLSENNNNILLGYAYVHGETYKTPSDKVKSDEHRIFQQFITKQSAGRFFLLHRYRIEERFIRDDYKTRFRYFLSLNVPVNKATMIKNAVYVSLSNEIFINGQKEVFDRNRIYGALGYAFSDKLRIEAGWMRQLFESGGQSQLQVTLFNNLHF